MKWRLPDCPSMSSGGTRCPERDVVITGTQRPPILLSSLLMWTWKREGLAGTRPGLGCHSASPACLLISTAYGGKKELSKSQHPHTAYSRISGGTGEPTGGMNEWFGELFIGSLIPGLAQEDEEEIEQDGVCSFFPVVKRQASAVLFWNVFISFSHIGS